MHIFTFLDVDSVRSTMQITALATCYYPTPRKPCGRSIVRVGNLARFGCFEETKRLMWCYKMHWNYPRLLEYLPFAIFCSFLGLEEA
jgi:hypothetical protein